MTQQQKVLYELWKDDSFCNFKLDIEKFSFMVLVYETKRDMLLGVHHQQGLYFPSVRAAVHYMDDIRPEVFFYEIIITDMPVNCPQPYFLEK